MSLEVVAVLSKVLFESRDKEYAVAEFIDAQSAKRFKASGSIVTLGKTDSQQRYRLFGDWESTPKYGDTFKVIYCDPVRPDSIGGIIPFLANNLKGVGEATAKKLLETLVIKNIDELIRVCRDEPQRVQEFFKSKKSTADKLIQLVVGDVTFRAIMIFLHEHNIPTTFANRIFERYGSEAVSLLQENPYRLISDMRNVGFLRADAIAQKLGIDPKSEFRAEAAIIYALESASDEGHCCLPRDILIRKTAAILQGKETKENFSFDFVLGMLRTIYRRYKESGEHRFVLRNMADYPVSLEGSDVLFYLPEIKTQEDKVGGFTNALIQKSGIGHESKETQNQKLEILVPELPWKKFSEEQRNAIEMSVDRRMMILTGGPGCGKTFVLKGIHAVQKALGRSVALCAPTGLAAKRMTVSIGFQAYTLHKLLRLGQVQNSDTQTMESDSGALDRVDVIIVDEASMLSLDLLAALLDAMGPNKRLILVGDTDQLPSVGAGHCLRDFIRSQRIDVARLTQIFRQGTESPIPHGARSVILGQMPKFTGTSRTHAITAPEAFGFFPCSSDSFYDLLLPLLSETIPKVFGLKPITQCQILVPMRKGEVGQEKINKNIQNHLNPPHSEKAECSLKFEQILRVGDKVIFTRNNYDKDVFNGDLGFCRAIRETKDKLEVEVTFDDRIVVLEDEEVEDLQLCYAMTIHKSQGSEFPLCIIPMFGSYYSMLDRNLLYTAITRASGYVLFLGEEWAIKKSIGNVSNTQRQTALATLIHNSL